MLAEIFAEADYDWPPELGPTVPPLALTALPSDLSSADASSKKTLFLRALLPLVLYENRLIRADRAFLNNMFARGDWLDDSAEASALRALARRYKVNEDLRQPEVQAELLRRVDEVPASLALAQAANESGWGTSRFALEGNSLFGQWTWGASAGLAPEGRAEGEVYSVRTFPSLQASVRAYMHNLNAGHAYGEFRHMRENMRAAGGPLNAARLADGLAAYSERGPLYIEEIKFMIRSARFDRRLAGVYLLDPEAKP
ncbi:MAG: hypothetical protein AMS22_03480 [Thiotrichales bacterium SG8_50]|nr:MAG: hypothetical protein AMS22_03480 [Thiotrichales bacterium SG8_50]